MHLERQKEIVDKLTEPQKAIYAGIGGALQSVYGTDQGFLDGLAAITALKQTMEIAVAQARAEGLFPYPGGPEEEHY